jgi:redox-sensitive bicupin YhaK (pirin superfamily)
MESQKRRTIKKIISPQLTSEGGGLSWMSCLFPSDYNNSDPFLSFDHFYKNETSSFTYKHISRLFSGMTTFIYLLNGRLSFRINENEVGKIKNGGGLILNSGIGVKLEQVFELNQSGLEGFQIGINLSSNQKLNPASTIIIDQDDVRLMWTENGIYVRELYKLDSSDDHQLDIIDLAIPAYTNYLHPATLNQTVFAYLYQGRGYFRDYEENIIFLHRSKLILFNEGDYIQICTEETPMRLLIVSGNKIGESISRYGSIVKNSQKEVNDYLKQNNIN